MHHTTMQLSLGTRSSPPSETERDPSNLLNTMDSFDCATVPWPWRLEVLAGARSLDFLTVPEGRTMSDLHKIDSTRVPSPISSPAFQWLYPIFTSRLDVESIVILLSTRDSTPELPTLRVCDGFTSTTTVSRKKEFEQGGYCRRRYGRAAS